MPPLKSTRKTVQKRSKRNGNKWRSIWTSEVVAQRDRQERGKLTRCCCLQSWEHDRFCYLLLALSPIKQAKLV
ncbi:hypothetical protein BT93_C0878 [Corymbia citriodora subsp. variegata]|nr:hypothetical protein BT93_C0878 [Corymbia citriodora subsp. variegata]